MTPETVTVSYVVQGYFRVEGVLVGWTDLTVPLPSIEQAEALRSASAGRAEDTRIVRRTVTETVCEPKEKA